MTQTGPNREAQIASVQGALQSEIAAWLASGYPAAAVLEALRRATARMEGR